MEAMGYKTAHKRRRSAVHSKETLYRWEEIQSIGSEELKAIIDIITAGHKPGGQYENNRS